MHHAAAGQTATAGAAQDNSALPGRYVTDGDRLFRLLAVAPAPGSYVVLEDCATLELLAADRRELPSWGLTIVRPTGASLAATPG